MLSRELQNEIKTICDEKHRKILQVIYRAVANDIPVTIISAPGMEPMANEYLRIAGLDSNPLCRVAGLFDQDAEKEGLQIQLQVLYH